MFHVEQFVFFSDAKRRMCGVQGGAASLAGVLGDSVP